ncbi:hypothetical protein DCC61_00765 [Candidatus Microgenomates bacterium]|nr:polyprenyl synthetase family protein [Candidatus Microgenomates bacterium CPR3]RIK52087.1 MAG: hypothetical protein DCC61_00765 [Candidatus Microgenomates bacterium]
MNLQDLVGRYKSPVDAAVATEVARRAAEVGQISPELVKILEMMRELSVGGKRMRGLLTVLGYQLAEGSKEGEEEVIKAAVVMELFHLGLLIHDDFMDQDDLRRGVATIHSRYTDQHIGESVAVLAGDYTFGWGVEILSSLNLPKDSVLKAMQVWGKYFTRVGYGQTLDVLKTADEKSLLSILALKSGEYSCVLPLQLGAALAGGNQAIMDKLYKYGMELGWVFQLRDDYLAEWGESAKTGKPVGNDRREDKHSFALMYGREKLLSEIERYSTQAKAVVDESVLHEIVEWVANRDN